MTTVRRVQIKEFGEPSVMKLLTERLPSPRAEEVQLRQTAIGFNFIDVYQRKGVFPLPLPTGLGFEAAGVIEAVGDETDGFAVGDRVAYMGAGVGAYADRRNVPANKLVKLPDAVSDEQAASILFKGLTAQYLVRSTYRIEAGDLVLLHAAAGGVGQIITRWATSLGAEVIGTTGTASKKSAIVGAGAIAAIDTSQDNWGDAFLEASGGRKAQVVYDSIGKATLERSLDCATMYGTVVTYGAASGPPPAIDPSVLRDKGELYLTAPSVFSRNANTTDLRGNAAELFETLIRGDISGDIGERFELERIADAHRAAEERRIEGAILILP